MPSALPTTQTTQSPAGTVIMPANSQITAAVVHSTSGDESSMDVTSDAVVYETNNVKQSIQGQRAIHENRKRRCNSDMLHSRRCKAHRNERNIDVNES